MIFYTKNLDKLKYNLNSNFLGKGNQGSVYKIETDKCLKIYNQSGCIRFDPCVFEIIKELSLDGIYKLYDLLYYGKSLKTVGAYTMKYYQSEIDNILDEPIDYTLDNINMLYNSILMLSKHQIGLRDSIPSNVILTKDQIVMIDMDYSFKTGQSRDYLVQKNTWQILYLFKRLYEEGLKKKE